MNGETTGDVFLAGGTRTAIGGLSGVFAETSAVALGRDAVRETLVRSGVAHAHVDEVILGNVLSAGLGQNVARQVSIGAGLSPSVGAMTVNKMCGSGLKAVMLAAQAIRCGDASVVVAGGTENMSQAPYLLQKACTGYRLGDGKLVDSMIRDGLWDAYEDLHMGTYADRCAARYGFSREAQDDFAIASYERALASAAARADEIVPVEVLSGRGTVTVSFDEEPKRFDQAKLRKLPPAFAEDGTVTAGNASSINDGAAAILVLSGKRVGELGVTPQARILGYATASREPEWFTLAPIQAIQTLLEQLGLRVDDIDLFEINEAFSAVAMAAMQELNIGHEKVNVHGGAVALGHPIGASGARTLVSLLNGLQHREAKIGINVLCIGGGEAVAMAVERTGYKG